MVIGRFTAMRWLRAFGRDRTGNVAMMWGLMGTVLIGLVGITLDFTRAQMLRSQMQNAVDGAALVAARNIDLSQSAREQIARSFFEAEMGDIAADATFTLTTLPDGTQRANASMPNPMSLASIVSPNTWMIGVDADALQSGMDVEVSMILDTTGSMAGQRIADLRAAAADLVDIVVREDQSDYYSKVALVPYSMAINAGPYAPSLRGAATPGRGITGAVRSSGNVTVTSASHGFSNGDVVYITGVGGITQLNNRAWAIGNVTANTFRINSVSGTSGYSGGGSAFCTRPGCEYYRFNNYSAGAERVHRISTCVTERTGAQAYTDASPSSAPVGRNYPATGNPCPGAGNVIVPLSDDVGQLTTRINALTASGSTGGHLGVAWGWYMLSPNFGHLWPSDSRPASYGDDGVLKIAVLMTDGEYNSSYCNGVISGPTSTSGSGSQSDQINCAAPNGHAFNQAQALCAAMKQRGVIVYTVGFDVVDDQRARDLVDGCATSDDHVYYADNGAELRAAFRAIALAITQLRLSR